MRGWLAADAAAWSLRAYLGLGLLLRLPAVVWSRGYEFVDQQYQYVDPAWHLASHDAWLVTWEWTEGLRSWVYPGLLAAVFWVCNALGLREPGVQMVAVRGLHALVSLLPLAAFWFVVVRWRPVAHPRPALLFAAAGLGALMVQPSGPTFAASLSVTSVLLFVGSSIAGPGRTPALLAGLCLGLAFCARFQDAFFGLALVGYGIAARRYAACAWLLVGCLPGLLAQAISDWHVHGVFWHSPWTYVQSNFFAGASTQWATRPWWFYLGVGVVPVVVLVPPFLRCAVRLLWRGARWAPAVGWAVLVYLVLHSVPERKSLRFVLPALWLLGALVALGVGTGLAQGQVERWHRRFLVVVQAGLWAVFSLWFHQAGPVRAASALATEAAFTDELLVVDGNATDTGGHYWLRRPVLDVKPIARRDLAGWLAQAPRRATRFLMVLRAPLRAEDCGGGGTLTLVGAFTGMLDLRKRERRWLYRLDSG